jgi:hypothetical protein
MVGVYEGTSRQQGEQITVTPSAKFTAPKDAKASSPSNRPTASQVQLPPPNPYNPADADVLRKVQEAVRKREASEGGAKDDDVLRDLQNDQQRRADSNILVSRGAIVCTTLTNAQIVIELHKSRQTDKLDTLKGCWFIREGREVVALNIVGSYALIAPMDELDSKAWTYISWLQKK